MRASFHSPLNRYMAISLIIKEAVEARKTRRYTKDNKNGCVREMTQPLCDPDATRTHDRLLRRQMLYPAELPDLPY